MLCWVSVTKYENLTLQTNHYSGNNIRKILKCIHPNDGTSMGNGIKYHKGPESRLTGR